VFTLPEAVVGDDSAVLQGLDGRKMSKSYNNTIALFDTEKKLRKSINKIKTNLLEPGEPKDPDDSTVFQLWSAFASPAETGRMRADFISGIAWGEAKKQLFELINGELAEARVRYNELMDDPAHIESVLQKGAQRARAHSEPLMKKVREAVGIGPIL
jgi:tryptophanyl-tRNA synthetase